VWGFESLLGHQIIQYVGYDSVEGTGKAFVVLFAVFFWTFLWGLPGAFIGVPIVIALLTFCEQHPSARWIAELFGSPSKDKYPAS
jgi:hypothetical protein